MSDKLRPSRRELITAGLVVFLVTALVWTVIDGAGANPLTISGVITRQNAHPGFAYGSFSGHAHWGLAVWLMAFKNN